VQSLTHGLGVDAVIIAAASSSNEPIELAGLLCREKGRVILLGAVPAELPRREYYEKELTFEISRAFGAGSYDKSYLDGMTFYPIAYVPWTVRRNMEAFLDQVQAGRVATDPLISHRFRIDEAPAAYSVIEANRQDTWGLVFFYREDSGPSTLQPSVAVTASVTPAVAPGSLKDSLGVSVIGCGNFARSYLIPNLRRLDAVNLRWLVASTPTALHHVARQHGFPNRSCEPADVLKDEGTDLVVIATRHGTHASLTHETLSVGKAVFVEKPLAVTVEQLVALWWGYLATARRMGRAPFVMVGFNRRFSPYIVRTRDLFAVRRGPLMMQYRVNAGSLPTDHWVYHSFDGGGRIVGEICHFVDLFINLTGSHPIQVHAETAGGHAQDLLRIDNVLLTVKFEDGSLGCIVYASNGQSRFPRERLEVFGEGRVAVVDNYRSGIFVGAKRRSLWTLRQEIGHRQEMESLVTAVRQGGPSPIPFEEAIWATMTTFAALTSLQSGEPVPVKLDELNSPDARSLDQGAR
jgi:predicted dehydrogenase